MIGPIPPLDYEAFWREHDCQDRTDSARPGVDAAAADLEAYAHAARERIEQLEGDVRGLEARIGGLGQLVDQLSKERDSARDAVETWRTRYVELQTASIVDAGFGHVLERAEKAEARVEQLEGEVKRLNAILDEVTSQMPAEKNPFNTEWHRAIDMVEQERSSHGL